MITAVIPIGTDDFSRYRRNFQLRHPHRPKVKTILVADGCSPEIVDEVKEFCRHSDFEFVLSNSDGSPFNASRARNNGINAASTEWIIQEDADLVFEANFYECIAYECAKIERTPFNFLTVPTIYLSSEVTSRVYEAGNIDCFSDEVLTALAFENPRSPANKTIQSYAPASGVLVHRREEAIALGGYDEGFEGWGGEDRDFAFRLLLNNGFLPRPEQFEFTAPWNLNDTVAYQGWRALYRLVGDYLALKGIYAYHLFHENNPWKNERSILNIARAAEKAHQLYLRTPPATNWDAMNSWSAALQGSILFDRFRHHSFLANSGIMQIGETSLKYKPRQWRSAESRNLETHAFENGRNCYRAGNYVAALENFLAAAKTSPKPARYLRYAAESQVRLHRRKDAIDTLLSAQELEPKNKSIARRIRELKRPWPIRLLLKDSASLP